MKKSLKISIVGGGSPLSTKHLVKDMFLAPGIQDAHFVLYDFNREAAELNAAFLRKVVKLLNVDAEFTVSSDPACLEGSDYIVITVSTGGFDAMCHDLEIPEQYGIYHTVGDSSGPGGWARFLRNFKPFSEMAKVIKAGAPDAVVLNYTNPMTTLTDLLIRLLDNPVIGLCHGLDENLEFVQRYCQLQSKKDININYAGLNHFFWCDKITVGGRELLAEFRKSGKSLNELLAEVYVGEEAPNAERDVASELFQLTGCMPFLGDRHTCEFFSWYITSPERLKKYRLRRTSVAERRQYHKGYRDQLMDMLSGEIPDIFLRRSRETAADIIEAHHTGNAFIDVGNLANRGQIGNLPQGLVVETAVHVDQNGFNPVCFGNLPDAVLPLVEAPAQMYRQLVDACLEGNKEKALQALRFDPACANLATPDVCTLGNTLIEKHKKWIDFFDAPAGRRVARRARPEPKVSEEPVPVQV